MADVKARLGEPFKQLIFSPNDMEEHSLPEDAIRVLCYRIDGFEYDLHFRPTDGSLTAMSIVPQPESA